MALEDVGITAQRGHALFNARAAAVVDEHKRAFHVDRHIHDAADFLGMIFAQRAADDREILGRRADRPPVHPAIADDHAVARHAPLVHAEIVDARFHQFPDFHKRVRVKQQRQPLPRGQFARRALFVHACLAAAAFGSLPECQQLLFPLLPKRCHAFFLLFWPSRPMILEFYHYKAEKSIFSVYIGAFTPSVSFADNLRHLFCLFPLQAACLRILHFCRKILYSNRCGIDVHQDSLFEGASTPKA